MSYYGNDNVFEHVQYVIHVTVRVVLTNQNQEFNHTPSAVANHTLLTHSCSCDIDFIQQFFKQEMNIEEVTFQTQYDQMLFIFALRRNRSQRSHVRFIARQLAR